MAREFSYSELIERLRQALGLTIIEVDDALILLGYINSRYRYIYEYAEWPENIVIEERTPSSALIAYEQSGKTAIAEFLYMWNKDPYGTQTALNVAFDINGSGAKLHNSTLDSVYVKFKKEVPVFKGGDYSASTDYTTGDYVFYVTDGNYYIAIDDPSVGTAPTDTDYWSEIKIPHRFFEYLVYSVATDFLSEHNIERANYFDKKALEQLTLELDKMERQQSQKPNTFIQTHTNSDFRN